MLQVTLLQLSVAVAPPFEPNQQDRADELLQAVEPFEAHLVIVGGVLSVTLMLALVVEVLPQASLAVNVTHTEPLQPLGVWPL